MSFLDKVIFFFQFHHHVFNRDDTFFFPYYCSQKNIRFKYVWCVHLRCNLVKNQVSFFYFKSLFYKKFGNYRYPTRYVRNTLNEIFLNHYWIGCVESTATFVIPRRTLIIALPCAQVEFTDPRWIPLTRRTTHPVVGKDSRSRRVMCVSVSRDPLEIGRPPSWGRVTLTRLVFPREDVLCVLPNVYLIVLPREDVMPRVSIVDSTAPSLPSWRLGDFSPS